MVHVNGPLKQLNFGTGKAKQGLPAQSNDMNSFSLSLCSYVCLYWLEIFCIQGLVLSARMYVYSLPTQAHPPKVKYSV